MSSVADALNDQTEEAETFDTDLSCEVCGVPLVYSGRGRKPKFCENHKPNKSRNSTSPRSNSDVNTALQVMETSYSGLSLLLRLTSPRAAEVWESSHDNLMETNRQAFIADKKLCQRIVKLGQTSGTGMFIGAHVFALAPVLMVVREDVLARRRDAKPKLVVVDDDVPSTEENSEGRAYPNQEYFE